MKNKLLSFILAPLILAQAFALSPTNVQKGGDAGANNITGDLNIGTGRTFTVSAGGTLIVVSGATLTIPAAATSAQLDVLGSTRGSVLYRGASGWTVLTPGTSSYVLTSNGAGADPSWQVGGGGGGGSGTVTSVALALPSSIITVSGSPVTIAGTLTGTLATQTANFVWAGPTTGSAAAPTFRALVAADIPSLSATYQPLNSNLTAIAGLTSAANKLPYFTGSGSAGLADFTPAGFSLALSANASVGGTNTGDQTSVTGNAGTATALQTARLIYGNSFDGTAALSQIIASTFGGTGNGFTKFTGPSSTEKTFTLPNASAVVLTDNTPVTVAQGGTGRTTGTTAFALIATGTSANSTQQTLGIGATTDILVGGGASALPSWVTASGSGAPLRATSPTITTPIFAGGFTASGSSANDFSGSTGTFLTSSGANTLSGAVTIADATTPSLTTASGKTNTGFLQVNGKTSGALKITAADAAAQTVTISLAAQTTGAATLTIPDLANISDTFAFLAKAQTFTNKRITMRIATLTDAATVTPATDSFDGGILTSLSQTTAFAAPTGTPTDGQRYTIRIKSTTPQTMSWSSSSGGYRGSADLPIPLVTTGNSKTDYFVYGWNAADSKWDLLGKTFGF